MKQDLQRSKLKFGIFPKLLIVLTVISVLPLLVVWYINYQIAMEHMTQASKNHLEAISRNLVTHVNDWIEMNSRMLRENAAEPDMQTMNPDSQRPNLRLIKEQYPWINSMLVIDLDGNAVSRTDEMPLRNYSDRRYFQQVVKGETMGQEVVIGRTSGEPSLALAVPIKDKQGDIAGVLVASMATLAISGSVTDIQIGETGYAFLLDGQGKVIAHQLMQDSAFRKDFSQHPAFVAHNKDGKSSLVYRDEDSEKTIISYMMRTEGGWTLVTHQDYEEAFRALASANRNAFITLAVTLFVVLIVAYVVSRRLTQPILHLTRLANEASVANFSALNAHIAGLDRRDEIGELARSVQRLATSLRVAMGRLRKKPERMSVASNKEG